MTGFELGSFGKGGDRAVNCGCLTISSNVKLEHFYGLEITQFQTSNQFTLYKEVNKISNMALGIDNAPVSKISIITEFTKKNDDNGITGIVVEKASLKQCHKTSDEKHLKCDFCDKGFKRRDHLKKHIREQYYKCFSVSNCIT